MFKIFKNDIKKYVLTKTKLGIVRNDHSCHNIWISHSHLLTNIFKYTKCSTIIISYDIYIIMPYFLNSSTFPIGMKN